MLKQWHSIVHVVVTCHPLPRWLHVARGLSPVVVNILWSNDQASVRQHTVFRVVVCVYDSTCLAVYESHDTRQHVHWCVSSVGNPSQEDAESGTDNLSHADTVRTLRALCFLAHNEKSHEDLTQQVFPTLVLLLPHLLGVLSSVAESRLEKDSGQVKDKAATPTGRLCACGVLHGRYMSM